MPEDCENNLGVWRRWQQKETQTDKAPSAKVTEAIEHVASCSQCFDKVCRLSFALLLEGSSDEQRASLADFLDAVKQEGIAAAALRNPSVAHFLTNSKLAYERFYVYSKDMAGFSEVSLPPDVRYTIDRQTLAINWVTSFARHFGPSEKGLTKQAKATLEFGIDKATNAILVSRRMVEAITETGRLTQVQMKDEDIRGEAGAEQASTRLVSIRTDTYSATVQIDARQGYVRVLLPYSKQVTTSPLVALILEDGQVISRQMSQVQGYYEATFSGISTGDYLLAIDIVERLKSKKQPSPVRPPLEPFGEPKGMPRGRQDTI